MPGLVDIHSHLLWGLDDGAATFEESLAMLRLATSSGTTHIVATPHINEFFHFDPNAAPEMIHRLREAAQDSAQIHLGAELRLDYENLQRVLANPALHTIDHGSYLLVEFSEFVPPAAGEVLKRLLMAGITPVIAHPERNTWLQKKPELLREWTNWNCVLQLTAQSVLGEMGREAKECSWRLIEMGLAHVVASDSHDTLKRPPRLDEAYRLVSRKWGKACAERLFVTNPLAIIEDELLPLEPEPVPSKRRHFIAGLFG